MTNADKKLQLSLVKQAILDLAREVEDYREVLEWYAANDIWHERRERARAVVAKYTREKKCSI